jgi:hypothetical protein
MITGYIEGYYGVELSWKERDSIISKLHKERNNKEQKGKNRRLKKF